MRDEIQRISKLVADGKLSPNDAADLIDAFYASERSEAEPTHEAPPPPADDPTPPDGPTPPPPPPPNRDPLKSLVDSIEKLTKETIESVDWNEVSTQARTSAKKGFEALKAGVEEISKGKINLGWMFTSEERTVEFPFSLVSGKTLKVENLCGDITISGSRDKGSVKASARFKGQNSEEAKSRAEAYTLVIEESDHVVLIRQPELSGGTVDLAIELPGTGSVEVRSEDGDISVSNTGGGCRIHSRTGDISLTGLDGAVEIFSERGDLNLEQIISPTITIELKSGDITGSQLKGNLSVRSGSGDIHLGPVTGKSISVEAVSGDIVLDLSEPVTGSLNIRTVSGDVRTTVGNGSDCRVSLSSLRGDVSTDLDLKEPVKLQQRITGRLGDGSGTLDISSVTGDVSLN